jgi:FkbM family methyltransferase
MKYPDFLKEIVVHIPILLRFLEWTGIKRDAEIATFFKHVHKGQIVFDIGANVGRFTKIFCMLVGEDGKVFAFEPVSINYNRLAKIGYKNLSIFKLALSNQSGETAMFFPPADGAQASMVKQTFGNWRDSVVIGEEKCEMASLDGLIEVGNIPTPQFIKIDVEGAELSVLLGAKKLLMENNIVLFLELNLETLKSFGISIGEIWDLLQNYGYRVFTLVTRKTAFIVEGKEDLVRGVELNFSPNLLCQKKS